MNIRIILSSEINEAIMDFDFPLPGTELANPHSHPAKQCLLLKERKDFFPHHCLRPQ
jgi:hypothetical protein